MKPERKELPERIDLPLNEEPLLNSYSHYSNPLAITRSPAFDEPVDALFSLPRSTFRVQRSGQYNLYCNADVQVSREADEVSFNMHTKDPGDGKLCYYYDQVTGDGEYVACVKYQKFIHMWPDAGLLISREMPTVFYYEDDDNAARLCLNRCPAIRSFYQRSKQDRDAKDVRHDYPVWLKIAKQGDQVSTHYSEDGEAWTQIDEFELDLGEQFFIGLFVKPCTDTFENWFFANHIQIHSQLQFDPWEGDVPVCFFYGFKQGENYNHNHPYLDVHSIERALFDAVCDPISFFCAALAQGSYVECYLDEFYIHSRRSYQTRRFTHNNLLFGYDRDREVFRLIGYDDRGQYRASEVPFSVVGKAFAEAEKNMPVFMLRPKAPEIGYEMNIPIMLELLRDYRFSRNSHERCAFFAKPLERAYGMDVYEHVLEQLDKTIADVRVFHMLYEHKKVMCLRLDYLKRRGVLTDEQFEPLHQAFSGIERLLVTTRNLQTKYRMTADERIKERISENLRAACEQETPALDALIGALEAYHPV